MRRNLMGSLVFVVFLACRGVSAQSQYTFRPPQTDPQVLKAYGILEAHCGKCHGADAAGGFTYRNREAMIARNQVLPSNPNKSRIYVRAILHEGGMMPPPTENNSLNAEESRVIRSWISRSATSNRMAQPRSTCPETCEGCNFRLLW